MRSALALGLLVAACAHGPHRMPPVPGAGGPPWREVASEHFTLWTDLAPDQAELTLVRMEAFRKVLISFVFGRTSPVPSQTLVIALRSYADWALFGDADRVGFFVPLGESPLNAPFLAFEAEDYEDETIEDRGPLRYRVVKRANATTTLQHELGHLVVHSLVSSIPAWLDEGVASYFETAGFDEKTGEMEIGRLPKDLMDQLGASQMDSVQDVVFAGDPDRRHQRSFYLRSQVLVAYLLNNEADRFALYQRVLKQVGEEQHTRVWTQVFGDRTPVAFEAGVDTWLHHGRSTLFHYKVDKATIATPRVTRLLSDADVHSIRALLYLALGRDKLAGLESARAGVAADASHLLANLLEAILEGRLDGGRAAGVAAAHPDDWRSWLLVWLAAPDEASRARAEERLCQVLASDPTQHAPGDPCKDGDLTAAAPEAAP